MTAKKLQKRNPKAENLRVLQAEDGSFYVKKRGLKNIFKITGWVRYQKQ